MIPCSSYRKKRGRLWLAERKEEHETQWVDQSLRNLTEDWLRHMEERFSGVNGGGVKLLLLQNFSSLNDPLPFVKSFFETAAEQLLAVEDTAYFLAILHTYFQGP